MRKPRGYCYDKDQYSRDKFYEFLCGRMRKLHKTQTEMGEVLGLSQVAFGQRMKKSNFDLLQLIKLFKALGVSDAEILSLMKQD